MALPDFTPLVGSLSLGQLVQDRLEKVHRQFPASRPRTLDDFRSVVDELSGIADICQAVVGRLDAQDRTLDAAAAYVEVKRALDWVEFLEEVHVDPIPTKRTLLFRAHQQTDTDQSGAYKSPAIAALFNDRYRQRKSVQDFLGSLGRHLGKTERETKLGRQLATRFTSTSPRLDWTLHLTGKKSREQQERGTKDQVSFVVFDLETLSRTPNVSVFRVSDVLRFLKSGSEPRLIPQNYQQWARNCDEYVIIGQGVQNAIIQFVPWSEIRWMPIINHLFRSTYTLGSYQRFKAEGINKCAETRHKEVCKMVVDSAKEIAGQKASEAELVLELVRLILKPGIWFWGIKTSSTEVEIMVECEAILEDELAVRMGDISLRDGDTFFQG